MLASPAPCASDSSRETSWASVCCCSGSAGLLGLGQLRPRISDLTGIHTLGPLELIQIGPGQRIRGRPGELDLSLSVEVVQLDRLGCLDLVLGQEAAGLQLEDVEPAGDLRAVDAAVVPVGAPVPAVSHLGRIHRPAVEEGDLLRVLGVGPVEYREPALVPGLHHHVPSRDRNQRAVVGHAVLLGCLRSGQLVIALELQLLPVRDGEDRVGAPLPLVGSPALGLAPSAPLVGEEELAA